VVSIARGAGYPFLAGNGGRGVIENNILLDMTATRDVMDQCAYSRRRGMVMKGEVCLMQGPIFKVFRLA